MDINPFVVTDCLPECECLKLCVATGNDPEIGLALTIVNISIKGAHQRERERLEIRDPVRVTRSIAVSYRRLIFFFFAYELIRPPTLLLLFFF